MNRITDFTIVFLFVSSFSSGNCIGHRANNNGGNQSSPKELLFSCKDLFTSGQDNVNQYRVPSLISTGNGTLIAVCDARVDKPGDSPNNIDLVLKRSFDNGKTWTKQKTIVDFPGNSAAEDASMVVDKQSNTIWLAYDYAVAEPQGAFGRILRIHLISSKDDGVTWSAPVDLSYLTKGKDFWLQNGPGVGLYKDGVIVFPMYTFRNGGKGPQQTVLVFSKDHGKKWVLSNAVGENNPEPQIAGLTGGKIMVNMRIPRGQGYRQVAITENFGDSWSDEYNDSTLIGPGCQGSIINYQFNKKSLLIFSNPADKQNRKNLVVRISNNEGKVWQKKISIYEGASAYSCLSQLQNGNVGLLFEADNYKRIVFVEIPYKELF